MHPRRTAVNALLVFACAAAVVCGCDEMKPRPKADTAAVPPPPPAQPATRDPNAPDMGHNSASTLGKARDSAVRGVNNAEKKSQEVAKQADEVFKTK
jgi:hypothetical protein